MRRLSSQKERPSSASRARVSSPKEYAAPGRRPRAAVHERAPPARGVDHEGRAKAALAGHHRALLESRHRGALEAGAALRQQPLAEAPVVEGAEGHLGEVVGDAVPGRADGEAVVDLQHALRHAEGLGHPERGAAGGGLHGADLVPIQ